MSRVVSKPVRLQMTQAPLPGLLAQLAVPAGLGYLFQTFFNVVDTFWAGQLSTDALAALSIAFPVFFLVIAASSGISTGATACIAHELGRDREQEARRFSAQTVLYTAVATLLLTVLGWVFCPAIFRLLGAEGQYLDLAVSYMRMIFIGAGFFLFSHALNAPLTASGDTKTFRNTLITGSLLNVALDPLFMYGLGPIPGHGFAGIAASTITIQALMLIYIATRAVRSGLIDRRWGDYKPRLTDLAELNRNILPATANMATVGLGIFIITFFISRYGKEAVAAYGIATRVEQIVLLPGIALSTATLALVGQNFGAGRMDRVREAFALACKSGLWIMLSGGAVVLFFRESLMGWFTAEASVIQYGSDYLLLAAPSLYAYVLLFTGISAMQGLKRPMFAIWIGCARQLIAPCLIFTLLAEILGWDLWGIWIGIVSINWIAAVATVLFVQSRFHALDPARH